MTGITTWRLIQYGFIAIPLAFAGFPLYILAPPFYSLHYGVSLTTMGVALFGLRVFDAIQDPLIGWAVDWKPQLTRWVLAIAGVVLCGAFGGIFYKGWASPLPMFVMGMGIAVTAYSVMSIALGAWGIRWAGSESEQTRVSGIREMMGLIGLIIGVSAPAYWSYSSITVGLAVLMGVGVVAWWRLPMQGIGGMGVKRPTISGLIWRGLTPQMVRLLCLSGLSGLASGIPAVLVVFFVNDRLQMGDMLGVFMLLYFVAGAMGMGIWGWLSRRMGKRLAWGVAHGVAIVGFLGAMGVTEGKGVLYGVICILSGLALGADLSYPVAIVGDWKGEDEGIVGGQVALLGLVNKGSLAMASVVVYPILEWSGYVVGGNNTEFALLWLTIGYAVIPCVIKGIAGLGLLMWVLRYPTPLKGVPLTIIEKG